MYQSLTLVTPKTADIPEGLYYNENYTLIRVGGNLFSICRLGNGVDIHIASQDVWKAAEALNTVCEWIFDTFDWCEMVIGTTNKSGVLKLAKRCGFEVFAENEQATALARVRK